MTAVRVAISVIGGLGMFAAIIFWPAGRLGWAAGWLYFAIVVATMFVTLVYLRRVNPELIEYRTRIGKGTKRWDIVWLTLFSPVFLGIYAVAGLDAVRFGWTTMPAWLWFVGLAVFVPGTALFIWSMGVNPFFEKTVRIQAERGHRVIDTGPYARVRHPGYVGFSAWSLSAPFLLGSWWAFVPAFLALIGIVVRTALEDRTLRAELSGYTEYAKRVRYRLIPGLW